VISCRIKTTRATSNNKCIKLPPTPPINPNNHKITNTIKIVQSIFAPSFLRTLMRLQERMEQGLCREDCLCYALAITAAFELKENEWLHQSGTLRERNLEVFRIKLAKPTANARNP